MLTRESNRKHTSYPPLQEKDGKKHEIQSTRIILKSKGPCETLRDIRTSTYQMYRIEENTNRTTKFH